MMQLKEQQNTPSASMSRYGKMTLIKRCALKNVSSLHHCQKRNIFAVGGRWRLGAGSRQPAN